MKVRFTERAYNDLSAILDYLSERSPAGAQTIKRSIHTTIGLISDFPGSGRSAWGDAVRVRPAGRHPYLIYWSVIEGEAWVVHIRDARRRPWGGDQLLP